MREKSKKILLIYQGGRLKGEVYHRALQVAYLKTVPHITRS